jgi:hypothetical protein
MPRRDTAMPFSGRPCTAALAAAVVLVSLSTALAVPARAGADPAPPRPAALDEDSALQRAAATGKPVEVPALTTETSRVVAKPAGHLTLEQSAVPVRARKDGAWRAIDTTLVRRSDGAVVPVATATDLVLSGGGAGAPLARMERQGTAIELTWPATLPAPTLSGDTATYAEVFPGVDLTVRADAGGMAPVLVVKSAAAATRPELRRLTFGTKLTGGTLRADRDGGFSVLDRAGSAVMVSPEPVMWDSTGATEPAPEAGPVLSQRERQRGPGAGDRVARMGLEVGGGSLTVVPDRALLTDPTARYPLFIDPLLSAARHSWAMVNASYPAQEYYKWAGDGAKAEGMGWTDAAGVHKKRLYWQFNVSGVRGKVIRSATFRAFETWSYSCTAAVVRLYRTPSFGSALNWGNQAPDANHVQLDYQNVAYGRTGCSPGGAWVEFDAKAGVTHGAANGYTIMPLMLRAKDETTNTGWKRFRNDAQLSIDYNTKPTVPTAMSTVAPSTSCVRGTGRPLINGDAPLLRARIDDPDGALGQTVKAQFEFHRGTGNSLMWGPWNTTLAKSGTNHTFQVPEGRLTEGIYAWRVRAVDALGAASGWSAYCELAVDPNVPAAPTVTPSEGNVYQVGNTVSFEIGRNGAADVVRYMYGVNRGEVTEPLTPAATDPTVVSIRLKSFGPLEFVVRSYDAAGNMSPKGAPAGDFVVEGKDPNGYWPLDDGAGTTAANTVRPAAPLTVGGGFEWAEGRWYETDVNTTDRALRLDGTSGAAEAPAQVVTDDSFSVSAKVKITDTSVRRVAVSQDGSGTSGFTLGYLPAGVGPDGVTRSAPAYAVTVADPRKAGSEFVVAYTPDDPAVFGEWTSLMAVYDAGARQLTLRVANETNAVPESETATVPYDTVATTGAFRVGRALVAGAPAAFWAGTVDEVKVFPGYLDPVQGNNHMMVAAP